MKKCFSLLLALVLALGLTTAALAAEARRHSGRRRL